MKISSLLDHHGIAHNPFSDEDAQTDPVFKEHCIDNTYHVSWDKVFGNPADPSTAIVFGEKGAGKTAIRLQITEQLARYNHEHPDARVFVVEYDDFNAFLDRFRDKQGTWSSRDDRVLSHWKLWDHMDAILALATTRLVDAIVDGKSLDPRSAQGGTAPGGQKVNIDRLDRWQKRDLLLLAACYDRSPAETFKSRWRRLQRTLRFSTWKSYWDGLLGVVVTIAVFATVFGTGNYAWLASIWPYLFTAAGWAPWAWRAWKFFWKARGVDRQVKVVHHEVNPLRQVLMRFTTDEIAGQPLPNKERTDDRYELLTKLQATLSTLGFPSIVVLVDRVDEPHLINGAAEKMKTLVWPLLDNKLLKHPGIGFKLLLPIELSHYIEREDRQFYERARLDKQNMLPPLQWTGEALFDIANSRLRACASNGSHPSLRTLFDETVSDARLMEALRQLRVPRHLFKFTYRVLVSHCNAHTDDDPVWQIGSETFEKELALFMRDQDAFDRGVGPG